MHSAYFLKAYSVQYVMLQWMHLGTIVLVVVEMETVSTDMILLGTLCFPLPSLQLWHLERK